MRICLLTLDLAGPVRNGGIGTAFAALAEALLAQGHDVTILYPAAYSETAPLAAWAARFAARGLHLATLHAQGDEARLSLLAAQWLMARDFDLVHFHEWRGIGFFAAQARRAGLGLGRTALVCQLHSPAEWHRRNSDDFAPGADAAAVAYMERRSAELADIVVSPSRYMLDWALAEGWALPPAREVLLNLLPAGFPEEPATRRAITEPVFFGRLEERKGLALFCAAIARLADLGTPPARVAFLGKVGEAGGTDGLSFLARAAAGWDFPWEVRNDLDVEGARRFLAQPGRLAVIASTSENSPYTVLECLSAGTPFVAADVGGIAELVHPDDRPAALFPRTAEALAGRLAACLRKGAPPLRPARDGAATRDGWAALHRRAAALPPAAPAPTGTPLVSVVLTTFDRPLLLAGALASLEAQDWPALEVVVVDDASPSPAARAFLGAVEPRLAARGWRLVRQGANAYLGAARNAGAAAARGEFIAFLDDDNIAYPNWVSTMARAALHAGAPIVTCQLHNFTGSLHGPAEAPATPNGWIPLGGPVELGLVENRFGDAGFLIRRDALDALGAFGTDRAGFEDWELLLRAALAGMEILCLPAALYHYRIAEGAMLRGMDRHQAFRSHARIARAWSVAPDGPALRRALALAAELVVAPRYPAGPPDLAPANAAPAFAALARRLRAARSPAAPLLMEQASRLAPGDAALAAEAAAMRA